MQTQLKLDFEDFFSTECSRITDIQVILFRFFSNEPPIVKILMKFRNYLIQFFKLKIVVPVKSEIPKVFKEGDKIGFFEIGQITQTTVVMGADDTHLNFRVTMSILDGILSCKTQVQLNNYFGRFYFFLIKPFHRLIVPMMLRNAARDD